LRNGHLEPYADISFTGHKVVECKNPRKINVDDVRGVTPDEALEEIRKAVADRDLDDVKEAVKMYVKAMPETTYPELEKLFRDQDIGVFLIGIEKEHILSTLTNMNLQGDLDKKFTVTYRFSKLPPRPRDRAIWPADDAENVARLEDGGEVVPRLIPKCRNCDELGHIAKHCPQDKRESVGPEVKCINCDSVGHRMRDCAYLLTRFATLSS